MMARIVLVLVIVVPVFGHLRADEIERTIAGSVQLDYLAVPTQDPGRELGLDGATVELSMKMAVDLSDRTSASVKVCFACHGFDVGMAFVDMRVSDALNFRVGRFTPAFGNFPLRHDPANHLTSDKPLPYDMGRMLRLREWNMSVLPAPWVDNGVEVSGTKFVGETGRVDYAVYAIGGPRGGELAHDFDFVASRTRNRYYVDNNSEPAIGARLAATGDISNTTVSVGASAMTGHYDPNHDLGFAIFGIDAVLQYKSAFLRAEYLIRGTEMATGDNPAERFKYAAAGDVFDDIFLKEGFYVEGQMPLWGVDVLLRWDGMRRSGNVLAGSPLRSRSAILRYTAAVAMKLIDSVRMKISAEVYDFSDFEDEIATHLGIVSTF